MQGPFGKNQTTMRFQEAVLLFVCRQEEVAPEDKESEPEPRLNSGTREYPLLKRINVSLLSLAVIVTLSSGNEKQSKLEAHRDSEIKGLGQAWGWIEEPS
jgi:hypothetical protein